MRRINFGTKAETLELLRTVIRTAEVKRSIIYTVADWNENPGRVLKEVQSTFSEAIVIVRSSVLNEDSELESCAGAYCSVSKVSADDIRSLERAIAAVVASFDSGNDQDQFFVQEQIQEIEMCGVVLTRDLDTLAPYYVVNYDDSTGAHDSVTSGSSPTTKTYVRFRGSPYPPKTEQLRSIVTAVQEVETIFDSTFLDIEFAIAGGKVYVLQVRPLVQSGKMPPPRDENFNNLLNKMYQKIKKLNAPHPGLHGSKALYSIMTDWNPAEMIGVRPRGLALSLYKELITDSIWAYQRDNYGYQNMRSFPLLISFLGCPYIDVRASFNSFVPKALDPSIAGKLVDHYIESLLQSPADHDKIEFNIIHSCYYLNLSERIGKLREGGFSDLEIDRIRFALLELTNKVVDKRDGLYLHDLEKVRKLTSRFDEIVNCNLSTIDKVYWLIEDCKRYGTLPFAGLARAGFIAVQLLRSIRDVGIFSQNDYECFMNSLHTVSSELSEDCYKLANGVVAKESFLARYGHLRPGTYDILSPRYDEAFETFFGAEREVPKPTARVVFELTSQQRDLLAAKILENGIRSTPDDLLSFIKSAIEGREFGKFIFTRCVSQVLKLLCSMGERFQLSRESMSYLDIQSVIDLYSNLSHEDVKDIFEREIGRGMLANQVALTIKLPQLITSEADVYDFFLTCVEPNYVTLRKVTAVVVTEENFKQIDLRGKIAFIRSADPGYDWVFSKQIAGLVTMYGGINSHMAIRCAELQIPAIIGCGEENFEVWSKAGKLGLDCENKKVTLLN